VVAIASDVMSWLGGLLRGGRGEVGWDDLLRRAVDAATGLRHWGPRGEHALPHAIAIAIEVPAASLEVVRGFAADPRFDRELGAMLANRLDRPVDQLPLREYAVTGGERLRVTAAATEPRPWQLVIEGGDLDGRTLEIAPVGGELVFGRAAGADPAGELVVCERAAFVSRRAGRLGRAGHRLEVSALDQGDLLCVRRASGELVRPARTASGRVAISHGDTIELGDGHGAVVRIHVRTGT
jgi:hypothetical protein